MKCENIINSPNQDILIIKVTLSNYAGDIAGNDNFSEKTQMHDHVNFLEETVLGQHKLCESNG